MDSPWTVFFFLFGARVHIANHKSEVSSFLYGMSSVICRRDIEKFQKCSELDLTWLLFCTNSGKPSPVSRGSCWKHEFMFRQTCYGERDTNRRNASREACTLWQFSWMRYRCADIKNTSRTLTRQGPRLTRITRPKLASHWCLPHIFIVNSFSSDFFVFIYVSSLSVGS